MPIHGWLAANHPLRQALVPIRKPIVRLFGNIEIKKRHRRILTEIKDSTGRLILACLCSLMISGATTFMGYLFKPVIDKIFVNQDATSLILLPFLIFVVFAGKGVGAYGQEYFMNYVGQNIIRKLRNQLYDRIQDLPLSFFQKERTGVLMSRVTNDVGILKSMVSTAVTSTMRDISTIIGLTAVIFYTNWRMAIFAFIILPVAALPIFELGKRVRRVSTGCQEAMADINAFLHETIAGNKIVKAFGMEQREKDRFFDKTQKLFKLEIKGVIIKALSSPLMELLGGVGIAFVIWYGGMQVINDHMTAGEFMSFLGCVLLLYDPIRKLSNLNNSIQQGLAAADRIYDVLETQSEIPDPALPKRVPPRPHTVLFDKVRFSYGGEEVLKGIDLTVRHGQVLALVGMSGGGKTTLVNLIPRFFDVTSGRICIGNIDIREFKVSDLRREIAVVTQDPILFNQSVRDNIAYGTPDADDAAIIGAAKAAYAHDFIQRFPEGYDTLIGELGGRLSGGEKQRLCIARALLKDAPILILDEATSSLDTEAEALVQKALENLMKGRTTFVIAHRLSTISNADQILVVIDGKIAEQGTHESLLAHNGEYAKLYDMQFALNNGNPDPEN